MSLNYIGIHTTSYNHRREDGHLIDRLVMVSQVVAYWLNFAESSVDWVVYFWSHHSRLYMAIIGLFGCLLIGAVLYVLRKSLGRIS